MRMLATLTAIAVVAIAPAALAAPSPDKGSVSAESPTFAWNGTAYGFNLAGEPCNTDHSCEDVLVEVKDAGSMAVAWQGKAPAGPAWLSVTIYTADASGKEGEEIADGGGLADEGAVAAPVEPGFYLVRVAGLLTSAATYEATAKLEVDQPDAAPAPPAPESKPQPEPQPQPAPQPQPQPQPAAASAPSAAPPAKRKAKRKAASCKSKKAKRTQRCRKAAKRRAARRR